MHSTYIDFTFQKWKPLLLPLVIRNGKIEEKKDVRQSCIVILYLQKIMFYMSVVVNYIY